MSGEQEADEASELRRRLREMTDALGGVAKENTALRADLDTFIRVNGENAETINLYRNMLVAVRAEMKALVQQGGASPASLELWISSIDQVVPRG